MARIRSRVGRAVGRRTTVFIVLTMGGMEVIYGAIAALGLLLSVYARLCLRRLRSPYYASLEATRHRRNRSYVYTPWGLAVAWCGFLLLLLGLFLLSDCKS